MDKKKITVQSLRKFNLVMGFLHLGQGIAILLLSKNFLLIERVYKTARTITF